MSRNQHSAAPAFVRCPECQWIQTAGARECSNCGYSYKGEYDAYVASQGAIIDGPPSEEEGDLLWNTANVDHEGGWTNEDWATPDLGTAPAAASVDEQAKAIQIQRGFEPAETIPQLVDAIRQDTAGIGACVSSITFLAETRGDVPKPVLDWVERLAAHLGRLDGKCKLALSARAEQ